MSIYTIKDANFEMRYLRFGKEGGQPIAVIPGAAIKSVMGAEEAIKAQYAAFMQDYDVFVFDRISHMPKGYTIYNMAADTEKAFDILGIKNADIFGVSQGGMIAQLIAADRNDLVRKLIVCSSAAFIPESAGKIMADWKAFSAAKDISALMQSFAGNVYSAAYYEKYRQAFDAYAASIDDADLEAFEITADSFEGFDVRGKLDAVKAPVLVLCGDEDKIFLPDCSKDIAFLTSGEIYIYSGEAHAVYDENADVLIRIKEFLDRK